MLEPTILWGRDIEKAVAIRTAFFDSTGWRKSSLSIFGSNVWVCAYVGSYVFRCGKVEQKVYTLDGFLANSALGILFCSCYGTGGW